MSTPPDRQALPVRELPTATGFRCWGSASGRCPNGRECVNAVRWALELGYRHIDTAQAYGNEESVGRALRESGVPREEVFITTKFYPAPQDPVAEAERSLERLGLDYVDLYLIHWPQGGPTWAWPGMEQARELGYARSIGVSNFGAGELEEVLAAATSRRSSTRCSSARSSTGAALLDACRGTSIAVEAYSPLGTGRHLSNGPLPGSPRARPHAGAGAAALVPQRGIIVHPEVDPSRAHRGERADLRLRALREDMAELDALDRTGGTDRALERKWW